MLSGISLPHILLLLLIVIMVFGTSKLKNLGKDLGGPRNINKKSMKGEDEPAAPTAPPAGCRPHWRWMARRRWTASAPT